jgi:hypothetical protein
METPPLQVLPCGCVIECVIENGRNTMKFAPCKMNCEYYLYVINEAGNQNKPVEYREV